MASYKEEKALGKHNEEDELFFKCAFPRLEVWFRWFNTSQTGLFCFVWVHSYQTFSSLSSQECWAYLQCPFRFRCLRFTAEALRKILEVVLSRNSIAVFWGNNSTTLSTTLHSSTFLGWCVLSYNVTDDWGERNFLGEAGKVGSSYYWHGRDAETDRELNPKVSFRN